MIPAMKKADYSKAFSLEKIEGISLEAVSHKVLRALESVKTSSFKVDGNIKVKAIREDSKRTNYIDKTRLVSDEKYILNINKTQDGALVEVYYVADKALFYAVLAVLAMAEENLFPQGESEDYPLFPIRGLIEGFYGRPWSFEERKGMIALAAKNKMNTFFYAPKDDDYHRKLWRDFYPAQELERLAALNEASKDCFIDFHYCIAPGLSAKYSDDQEFETLVKKTKQLYDAGINNFGLLFDDINLELEYEEGKAVYGETVNAHIDWINRYEAALKEIDEKTKLTVCPTVYCGRGDEYYIAKLGQNIGPAVSIFWTGRDVCSRDLTSPEAFYFHEHTNHKILYWDNYPVNDAEMYNEMHIGPIKGRDKDLYLYSEGLIANCMEYVECTKIPLITISDYLWDSENYDPDASWAAAIEQVVGKEDAEAFAVIGDHMLFSYLRDDNSKRMIKVLEAAAFDVKWGKPQAAFEKLTAYIEEMDDCIAYLKSGKPICLELGKWAEKFYALRDIVAQMPKLLKDPSKKNKEDFLNFIDVYEAKPGVLARFHFKQELSSVMDVFDF